MYMDFWQKKIKDLCSSDAVILDTETTGVSNDARVIELAIIDMNGNVLFNSLFSIGEPLPDRISALTGITDEMLEGQAGFAEKIAEIRALLEGKTVIAWNADFDHKRIWHEFGCACASQPLCDWQDAMSIYAYSCGKRSKWCKLQLAKEEMGIGGSQEHRAVGDCLDTLAVLQAACRGYESRIAENEKLTARRGKYSEEEKKKLVGTFLKRRKEEGISMRMFAGSVGIPYYTFRDFYHDPKYNPDWENRYEFSPQDNPEAGARASMLKNALRRKE